MKKITAGIISLGLCTTLLVAGIKTAANVSAEESETMETVSVNTEDLEVAKGDVEADGTEQIGEVADGLLNSLISSVGSDDEKTSGLYKEETVFIVADATGNAKKIIVSDWLKNNDKEAKIADKTELKDIVNLKGEETYVQNDFGINWEASGSDISYQGTVEKQLPVTVKVSYFLDGKSVSPEEIKGKSGHVLIRFDYENLAEQEVEVSGKKEKMTVPFTMLTGVILDDDKFTNITAKTAKLLNDGSRTLVVGISFPGMQENLDIDSSKFEIPDHLEIEADVQDFSLSMTVTAATTELFAGLDKVDVNSLDSISDSMGQLTDAMKQLQEGSDALSDGLGQLLEKSGELENGIILLAGGSGQLKDGIKSADDGVGKLKDGAGALNSGAGQLADGCGQLKSGLDTLAANNEMVMGGALQVFNSLLSTVEAQLKEAGADVPTLTVDNYAQVLEGVETQLKQGVEMLKAFDPDKAAEYSAKAEQLAALKSSLDSYNMFYQGLGTYTTGVAQAAAGAEAVKNGADSLKAGSGELKAGIDSLKEGTSKLYSGAETLDSGLAQLKDNIPALKDGVTQLYDGSVLLKDGIKEFNDQGISKITEAVEGDLEGLIERVRVMGSVAKDYNNFAGISEGMNGQVKFIYRTEEIK